MGRESGDEANVYQLAVIHRIMNVSYKDALVYHCISLQIGNEREVMYFGSKSEKERDAWIETFRIGMYRKPL